MKTQNRKQAMANTFVKEALGRCSQLTCAGCHGVTFGAISAVWAYSPKIYITNFQADATVLGMVMVVVQVYEALIIHPIAKWSDAGKANCRLIPIEWWGRRAPFALIACPILILGVLATWITPTRVDLTAGAMALWYGGARLLDRTAKACYFVASETSTNELFPTKDERVAVAMYRQGFNMIGILFVVFVGNFALSVEPGTADEKATFLCIGGVSAVIALMMVPHVFEMRKTSIIEPVHDKPNIVQALKIVFSSKSAWPLMATRCLQMGIRDVAVIIMPFYLQYGCGVSVEELGKANSIMLGTQMVAQVLLLPLFERLVRRHSPSRLVALSMIVAGILSTPILLVSNLTGRWSLLVLFTIIVAITQGIADISLSVLLGIVTDEDQVMATMNLRDVEGQASGIAPRRDGVFWSAWTLAESFASLVPALGTILFGLVGLDASLDDEGKSQPQRAVLTVTIFFVGTSIFLFLAAAFAISHFPLVGEKLAEVQSKYNDLFNDVVQRTSLQRSLASSISTSSKVVPASTQYAMIDANAKDKDAPAVNDAEKALPNLLVLKSSSGNAKAWS